jgi:hypothetical protein
MMDVSSYGFKVVARSPKTENMTLNWHDEKASATSLQDLDLGTHVISMRLLRNAGDSTSTRMNRLFLL